MKLYDIRGAGGPALSTVLKADDSIDELRTSPRLGCALRLAQSDDVCCRFLDNAKAIHFQLANDCPLPRSRRAGHNVSLHDSLNILHTLPRRLHSTITGYTAHRRPSSEEM